MRSAEKIAISGARLHETLQRYWGHAGFRPPQEQIIHTVLSGEDALALLPTGGGKSLCYQLPAVLLQGCCLVISPLIALMQDQVAGLQEKGIPAAALHSGMGQAQVLATLQRAADGELKLLYVSPERLRTRLFNDSLQVLRVSLIAVDEAHCISQWGHDFRPDYRNIAELRYQLPDTPVLALTATATTAVAKDIREQLRLSGGNSFKLSFDRPNIFFGVQQVAGKDAALLEAIRGIAGSIIVYCKSRKGTEATARMLQQQGIAALAYHAGMAPEKRIAAQEAWMSGEAPVMAATTAFGMGIDKADVRLVAHYDAPEDLESYYQEAGRAGRDDMPAKAIALFQSRDLRLLEESTALHFPPVAYLREVYQAVCEFLQVPIGVQPPGYLAFELSAFCKAFGLKPVPASNAIRQLAREGLWVLNDQVFQQHTAVFKVERFVIDQLAASMPEAYELATWLLRLHEGILRFPAPVDLKQLSKKLKKTLKETDAAVRQLHQLGIIQYQLPVQGPQLFFTHRRADSRYLLLDVQHLDERRNAHQARVSAITDYIKLENSCRTNVLLRYFGEEQNKPCGHCDNCLKQQAVARSLREIELLVLHRLPVRMVVSLAEVLSPFSEKEKPVVIKLLRSWADEGRIRYATPTTISLR